MDNEILLPLLVSTAQGDKRSFATLYEKTSGKLFAISLKMLGNRAQAEEALQDAYVKIWHNASEYQAAKGQVMSWMISIVRYRSLDILRHNKVRKEQSYEGSGEGAFEVYDEQESGSELNESFTGLDVSYDEKTKLVDCMEQLDEQQRQTIHLAYYKGLSHLELVKHVSSPLGTVKSWIRRGLQQLQRCLAI